MVRFGGIGIKRSAKDLGPCRRKAKEMPINKKLAAEEIPWESAFFSLAGK